MEQDLIMWSFGAYQVHSLSVLLVEVVGSAAVLWALALGPPRRYKVSHYLCPLWDYPV